jgi:hypothetical protein
VLDGAEGQQQGRLDGTGRKVSGIALMAGQQARRAAAQRARARVPCRERREEERGERKREEREKKRKVNDLTRFKLKNVNGNSKNFEHESCSKFKFLQLSFQSKLHLSNDLKV